MIERADHKSGFTVIDNGIFRDDRLSLKARGLLVLMLSMADEWEFNVKGLSSVSGVGVDGISALLKELERCGYITREREHRADGTFGKYLYTVHELPKRENTCTGEKPIRENTCTGKIPSIRNIKEERNNNVFKAPTVEQVRSYCEEHGYTIDPERFVDYYEARGWMLGKSKMKSWQAAVRTWSRRDRATGGGKCVTFDTADGWEE